MPELHKYSGAGNDFVVLDGRSEDVSAFRTPKRIAELCDRKTGFVAANGWTGADGLMILTDGGGEYDFRMEFYNPDGSGGMMCGNGGRCIAAFADALGLKPRDGGVFRFLAADGPHTAEILSRAGIRKTVRLRMIDVQTFHPALDGWFVDTGTRHFVRFVPDADKVDVEEEGPRVRWNPVFAPFAGATITIDGAASEFVTDENGQATVCFAAAGSYLLSAVSDDLVLVPPVCKVTAAQAAAPAADDVGPDETADWRPRAS